VAKILHSDGLEMSAKTVWTVPATVDHVHDGDTVVVLADLGPYGRRRKSSTTIVDLGWHLHAFPDGHIRLLTAVRVDGINADELATPKGQVAAAFGRGLLPPGTSVSLVSKALLGSFDKFGRVLGDLTWFGADGKPRDFAQEMLTAGMAVPWDGQGPKPTNLEPV
jgi:endonuclease YncB( thermonuclease family)